MPTLSNEELIERGMVSAVYAARRRSSGGDLSVRQRTLRNSTPAN
jgi:hypothetical protein